MFCLRFFYSYTHGCNIYLPIYFVSFFLSSRDSARTSHGFVPLDSTGSVKILQIASLCGFLGLNRVRRSDFERWPADRGTNMYPGSRSGIERRSCERRVSVGAEWDIGGGVGVESVEGGALFRRLRDSARKDLLFSSSRLPEQ